MPQSLRDKLRAKRFVFTAEVTPPVSADRDELLAKALPLQGEARDVPTFRPRTSVARLASQPLMPLARGRILARSLLLQFLSSRA